MKVSKSDNLGEVCTLVSSNRYKSILEQVDVALSNSHTSQFFSPNHSDDDLTYKLLVDCNQLAVEIENEIFLVHNFIRDHYRPRFPELESLVHHPIDFARVIKAIGHAEDITQVELGGVLPISNIMVVTVTASTTSGNPMSTNQLNKVLEGCDMALQLDVEKAKILSLVEKKMNIMAPNLSMALGSSIAAKLMGLTGGLINISKIPACNIQISSRKVQDFDSSVSYTKIFYACIGPRCQAENSHRLEHIYTIHTTRHNLWV
jgi:U4/U6 small nuclear ribonucleoprotein PRP31